MLASFSRRCGLLAFLSGLAGLVGSIADIPLLIYVLDGFPAMSPNTAISLILSGAALFLLDSSWPGGAARRLALSVLLMVFLFAFLALVEWVYAKELVLLHTLAELVSGDPGTVTSSPYTAILLLLMSLSMMLYGMNGAGKGIHRVQFLQLASLAVLLVVLSGYLFSVQQFYQVDVRQGMALHTFFGLASLSLGGLFLQPNAGIFSLFKGGYIGSRILRRSLIPVVLSLSVFYVFGVIAGKYSAQYLAIGFLLIVLSSLYFMSMLAFRVNHEEALKDRARNEFDDFFNAAEDGLIVVDEEGRILRVNPMIEKLTFYRPGELIAKSPEFLMPEHLREKHLQHRKGIKELERPRTIADGLRSTILRKDGSEYPVLIGLNNIQLDNRKLFVVRLRDINDQLVVEKELFRLGYEASHDALTGLPNRNVMLDMARREFAAAARRSHKVAVCFCDLDDFKAVNDHHGHRMGDRVLIEVARRLEHALRRQDLVCRVGVDEFVVLITDVERAEDAEGVVEKLIEKVCEPYVIDNQSFSVGISVGMTFYPDNGSTLEELTEKADKKLYEAKHSKSNLVKE